MWDMKDQPIFRKVVFGGLILAVAAGSFSVALKAESAIDRLRKKSQAREEPTPESVAHFPANYIAIGTGEIRDGEQVPLPKYQDGTMAKRSESRYIVSPKEMSTAFTHLGGGGAYFIRCEVDQEGFAHASLWQYDGAGQELNVIEDKSYEELEKYYETIGTQYEGSGDFRANLMKTVREKVVLNYMVIAIRSSKK